MEELREELVAEEAAVDEDANDAAPPARSTRALARTLSHAQQDGLRHALQVVSMDRERLETEGLSQISFTLGVLNITLTAFLLGRFPEFFWLWHTLKSFCLVTLQVYRWIPLKRQYYTFDLCWVITFLGIVWGILESFQLLTPEQGRLAFVLFFAFANGPLGWSVIILQNRLVFHSVEHSSSLFVHMSPILVTWAMRWNARQVEYRFGETRFNYMYDDSLPTSQEFFFYPLYLYGVWWVAYSIWLIVAGIKYAENGYDTVFDYNRRKVHIDKHPIVGKWPIRQQAIVYMVLHAAAFCLVTIWPWFCWQYKWLHTAWAAATFAAAAFNGASYYNYWLGTRYARALQSILNEKEKSGKKTK